MDSGPFAPFDPRLGNMGSIYGFYEHQKVLHKKLKRAIFGEIERFQFSEIKATNYDCYDRYLPYQCEASFLEFFKDLCCLERLLYERNLGDWFCNDDEVIVFSYRDPLSAELTHVPKGTSQEAVRLLRSTFFDFLNKLMVQQIFHASYPGYLYTNYNPYK